MKKINIEELEKAYEELERKFNAKSQELEVMKSYNQELKKKLSDEEEIHKILEDQLQDMERSKLSWENEWFKLYNTLKNYREVTEKKIADNDKIKNNYAKLIEIYEKHNQDKYDYVISEFKKLKKKMKDLSEKYSDFSGVELTRGYIRYINSKIMELNEERDKTTSK